MSIEKLKAFETSGLEFVEHRGLLAAKVDTPQAKGMVFLHGAHVTSWTPTGQQDVLWMSESSFFELGKPIRGGVPICFPWFGPYPSRPDLPAHGLARTKVWDVARVNGNSTDGIEICLATTIDRMRVEYSIGFGSSLRLSLTATLAQDCPEPRFYEDALHTYFSVSDIEQISIEGLESRSYMDKMQNGSMKPRTSEAIRFNTETDRVYVDTNDDCLLVDPGWNRKIRVSKLGSQSTVIWNPWIEKSARMPDFGDDEWKGMVCIETANVGNSRVRLVPGRSHITTAIISVE